MQITKEVLQAQEQEIDFLVLSIKWKCQNIAQICKNISQMAR
jgi:hypothetical protein